jgi:hypothetical protein
MQLTQHSTAPKQVYAQQQFMGHVEAEPIYAIPIHPHFRQVEETEANSLLGFSYAILRIGHFINRVV